MEWTIVATSAKLYAAPYKLHLILNFLVQLILEWIEKQLGNA